MLHIVFGRSGSGKTVYAQKKAHEAAKSGRVVLIVPEQFTFETERSLVRSFGAKSCIEIETLSFSRLSQRVMSECGGFACRYIDDCGRNVLMRLALRQVSDMLRVYSKQAETSAFVKTMVGAVAEYKMCGIDADMLDNTAKRADSALLRLKLSDIAIIMRTYCALLENSFADPYDDLTRLAKKLDDYAFFEGKTVVIDGFKGFTVQERKVIERILSQAREVYVTLCAESLGDGFAGLFSPVEKTARQLIGLANKRGCPVAPPQKLTGQYRFECDSLKHLESAVFRPKAKPFDGASPEIRIVSAQNTYEEARFVACETNRLVREKGCRYGDIAVISRGLDNYDGILDAVFEECGIPLFYDSRRSVATHPLMALVMSLMDIMIQNFRQEHILRYLKTGLAGFTVEEIAQIENYILIWDIKGGERWSREWTGNPSGFENAGDMAAKELEVINGLRERIYKPIAQLKEKMEDGDMALALYEFLCENGARDAVTSACRSLKEAGETQLSDQYAQIWEKLISILDQITVASKGAQLTLDEFASLLGLVIENTDLGSIPPSLDAVTAGDAERIRTAGAKYVFVIGLAEGIFPRPAVTGGLISDSERRSLIALGLELSPPAGEQAAEERFFAYKAFTCASCGVYLTYPRNDEAGRALRPSYFVPAVKKLFPHTVLEDDPLSEPLAKIVNEKTAFDLLAQNYREDTALCAALKAVFQKKEEYAPKLAALERAANGQRLRFSNAATARALYGEDMFISPSRVETFEQCRFMYFCRYGLKAKPRRKAELDAPEIGTVIHFVLERLLSQTSQRGLSNVPQQELEQLTKSLLDEFAKVYLGGLDDKPDRFRHLFGTLADTVLCLVKHMAEEFAQSGFTPVDFELAIGRDGGIEPYRLKLSDGGQLVVGGKVDRVDILRLNGKTYLRVIDYKTGTKTFNLNDVLYGLNLQMFIYLFTVCDNGAERYNADGGIIPAGVLYVPAKRPEISAERDTSPQEIKEETDKELRMSGLVIDEPDVILGMESSGAGRFIPAAVKSAAEGGTVRYAVSARSFAASLEQFGILRRQIEKTLVSMSKTLRAGDAAAVPVNGLGYNPCQYCDYACVCGFEPGCAVKNLAKANKDEIWERMKGDDGDGTKLDA
jgi:ATP-dependent helicase/nuclease subunit B